MQCLVSDDKFELIKVERSLTIEKCLEAPLLVNQKEHEPELIKSVFLIVKRFNDLVNVGKKMNEDQMIDLSADLFERFAGESIEDIMLFFKMARSGSFGDIYRLDSVIVLSWIEKYMMLKIEAREYEIQSEINIRVRAENDAVKNHKQSDTSKEKMEELARKIKVTTMKRNTGVIRKDNPLFDYNNYLEMLPGIAKDMDDKKLSSMLENTSRYSHPEVFKILHAENETRKNDKNKRTKRKTD